MRKPKSHILRHVALWLLPSACCCPVMGEQPDSLYWLNDSSKNLDEVEVVAYKVRQDVVSSAPLFFLDEEKMKELGVADLTEALHRMPGLNIRDYGGAGGMKTVSVRGLGASHTGVIYDGVPLSDAQNGQIDLSRYSLDNVDDLSLSIGDNNDIFTSARSSASAAGIVINTGAIPLREDTAWHFTGQLRVGSFRLINPYIKLGKSFSPRLSFSAIGEYSYAKNNYPFTLRNGILVSRERRDNSRMSCGHGELNMRWCPTDFSSLTSKLYYYDNDRQLPGPVILYNPESDDTLHDKNFFGQVSYENHSVENLRFRGLAKFNWDATYYHEVDGKYSGGYKDENYVQREYYLSGLALWSPLPPLSLSYCADYFFNNLTSNDVSTVSPRRHSLLQALSAKFSNSWMNATARLLYSVYLNGVKMGEAAPDRKRLSPSLSLSFQPFRQELLFVRISYKNIFRMPTFNECYYVHLGSLALKPETTDQFNLGVTWQHGAAGPLDLLVLTTDVYANKVKDKIVAIPRNMFVWTMMNLAKVRAFGADITLECTFIPFRSQSLTVSGNYSWQRVQPRTAKSDPDYNKQVAYTPEHSGAASLTWKNPWVDVVLKVSGAGERYGTNSNLPVSRLKGYVELGAALMKRFNLKGHQLDLRLDALNILDEQYEIVRQYPMPGRSFRLTATFEL